MANSDPDKLMTKADKLLVFFFPSLAARFSLFCYLTSLKFVLLLIDYMKVAELLRLFLDLDLDLDLFFFSYGRGFFNC